MSTRHDPSSILAQRCISSLLGVDVEQYDVPPREGAYDLRYERHGRSVAVEVKSLFDPSLRAAQVEASKTGYVLAADLAQSWTLCLHHEASWKAARKRALPLLIALEEIGWPGGGDLWRLRRAAPSIWTEAEHLGVASAWPSEATELHPPGFYLMPDSWGGGVPSIDAIPAFCDEVLASDRMAKLRRQLADADTDERHAFLVVGWSHMIIGALDSTSEEVPDTPPTLLDGVDGVWITGVTTGSRVLAWLPGDGWIQGLAPTASQGSGRVRQP